VARFFADAIDLSYVLGLLALSAHPAAASYPR